MICKPSEKHKGQIVSAMEFSQQKSAQSVECVSSKILAPGKTCSRQSALLLAEEDFAVPGNTSDSLLVCASA